jgi:hypothetical protein
VFSENTKNSHELRLREWELKAKEKCRGDIFVKGSCMNKKIEL